MWGVGGVDKAPYQILVYTFPQLLPLSRIYGVQFPLWEFVVGEEPNVTVSFCVCVWGGAVHQPSVLRTPGLNHGTPWEGNSILPGSVPLFHQSQLIWDAICPSTHAICMVCFLARCSPLTSLCRVCAQYQWILSWEAPITIWAPSALSSPWNIFGFGSHTYPPMGESSICSNVSVSLRRLVASPISASRVQ